MTGMYYDYALAAPCMAGMNGSDNDSRSVMILGMGSGTYASYCVRYYPGVSVQGAEIDRKIADIATEYFGLPDSVEVAVELYYSTFTLYTADLRKLFPDASATTLSRLKRVAREYTLSNGLMLIDNLSVPTDDAYKAWGLDIGKLEAKFKKLQNLGLRAAKEETA